MNEITIENISIQEWRLNNLYEIQDRNAHNIPLKLNAIQTQLLENLHTKNLVLKTRQSGIRTFILAYMLDTVLFNPGKTAIVLIPKVEDVDMFFGAVLAMLDGTQAKFKEQLQTQIVTDAYGKYIAFSNGSRISVRNKVRSEAISLLYIPDFMENMARIDWRFLIAEAGSIFPVSEIVFIDTTEHFKEAAYYLHAVEFTDTKEGFKIQFFPWWKNPDFIIEETEVQLNNDDYTYFRKVEENCSATLTEPQKRWYVTFLRGVFCGDRNYMRREYPSYWEEADEL